MTSEQKLITLHVLATGQLADYTHITIYNAFDIAVAKGYYNATAIVPAGLYRVILELNEKTLAKDLRVDKDISIQLSAPLGASAFVLEGMESSHEYYTYDAMNDSRHENGMLGEGSTSSLFLFFRYPDRDSWLNSSREILSSNFYLLDGAHRLLQPLDRVSKEDLNVGSLSSNLLLPPGQYFLQYLGDPMREIPLRIFNGWQTQVFMTFMDKPLFSTMRIAIEPNADGFQNNNRDYYLLDAVIQKFQNGIYFIHDRQLEELAYGKWQSPMLGMLAAYIYLITKRDDKEDLFRAVVNNLSSIILSDGAAPDLQAMQILKAIHFNEPVNEWQMQYPPMLAPYLKTVVRASSSFPSIVEEDSFLERIIGKIYDDCIYTSYVPLNPVTDSVTKQEKRTQRVFRTEKSEVPQSEWMADTLEDLINNSQDVTVDIASLARKFAVTPNVMNKIANQVASRTRTDVKQVDKFEMFRKAMEIKKESDDSESRFNLF